MELGSPARHSPAVRLGPNRPDHDWSPAPGVGVPCPSDQPRSAFQHPHHTGHPCFPSRGLPTQVPAPARPHSSWGDLGTHLSPPPPPRPSFSPHPLWGLTTSFSLCPSCNVDPQALCPSDLGWGATSLDLKQTLRPLPPRTLFCHCPLRLGCLNPTDFFPASLTSSQRERKLDMRPSCPLWPPWLPTGPAQTRVECEQTQMLWVVLRARVRGLQRQFRGTGGAASLESGTRTVPSCAVPLATSG